MAANYQLQCILAQASFFTTSTLRYLLWLTTMIIAGSDTDAQTVYLNNTNTGCVYKVKVYYAEGDCHEENNFWVCTGTQSSVLLTVNPGSTVTYSLPPNTGACAYEIYDGSNILIASCNCSAPPYYCNAFNFTDCQTRQRYIDMNSNCEDDVVTGTVKFY